MLHNFGLLNPGLRPAKAGIADPSSVLHYDGRMPRDFN